MSGSVLGPTRPYMLRAFYEWMQDNELTPHLLVNADWPGVQVPRQFVEDGSIVLNIAAQAVGNLELGNDEIRFNARFSGQPMAVRIPLGAVNAIYARENGAGTAFVEEPAYAAQDGEAIVEAEPVDTVSPTPGDVDKPKASHLKVIK